jgi:hypothetical protein
MAQTAITSPTDVVEFLTSQHEQIKSLFAKTLSASGEAREKGFIDLRRLLAVHELWRRKSFTHGQSERSPTVRQ